MYGTLAPSDILNRRDPKPVFVPGGLYRTTDSRVFRYVQFVAESADAAPGGIALLSDTNTIGGAALSSAAAAGAFTPSGFQFPYKVTADRSESLGIGIGGWTCALTSAHDGYYTFIQAEGLYVVNTDGGDDIVALDSLGVHATADGGVVDHSVTAAPVGIAVMADDDSTNRVLVWLKCL